ncbi:MAG: methyltransferase domain-containing protein [bacterium]|nr:methyltransferase domain-containing protein [bacterium]
MNALNSGNRMPDNKAFDDKWRRASNGKAATVGSREEVSLFVERGRVPVTQRQFNLYHYFEYIGEIAKNSHARKSLEIGCGRATISLYLNKYLGIETVATDISDDALALARKNIAMIGAVCTVLEADAGALPFPDKSFDLVVSIGLLEHLDDYGKILAEQYRVLRKGGVMILLNIPKKFSVQFLNTLYRRVLRAARGVELYKDYYRNNHSPAQYASAAERAGFSRAATMYVNSFPLFTPVPLAVEHFITALYRFVYRLRGTVLSYPFRGSRLLSQAHFLTATKL